MKAQTTKPRVVYATIYPPKPGERAETFITRELLREYLAQEREFDLSVVIASAHRAALEEAEKVLREFPSVPSKLIFIETRYAGKRGEEISFCKEQLPQLLMEEEFDWLLFMDADVWTPITQVPEWMACIGVRNDRRFVKIKYCLRNQLASPHHTLGAYFHHKALLARMKYWRVVFPKYANGSRMGAPDCNVHDYLEKNGCKKIVPDWLTTYHFLDEQDAHVYRNGDLLSLRNARDDVAAGAATRKAMDRKAGTKAAVVSAIMVTGKSEAREWLAQGALRCFEAQTYPAKELIIVNHGGRPLRCAHPDVREIVVPIECRLTLGDLRNIGLAAASGEWVLLWDDDDWHAPERIAVQVKHARRGVVVLLQSQIRYDFRTNTAFVHRITHGIDGTMIFHREVPFRFPSLRRGEDSVFLRNFAERIAIDNDAGLFVRFAHEANTWNAKHIMHAWAERVNEIDLPERLKAVLFEKALKCYRRPAIVQC